MSGALTGLLLAATLGAPGDPPTLAGVTPDPLPLGLTGEVAGSDFVDGQTTVTIAAVAQSVVFVDPAAKVVFITSLATPLGAAELVVTTPYGQASAAVTVAPAPPKIVAVNPNPVLLGSLATIDGENLLGASDVRLGDVGCEMTAQTDQVIVFEVPFDGALIGEQDLVVTGDSGFDLEPVTVAPPTPQIEQLAPNPVRQGDLVTIKGAIVAWNPAATIGGQDAVILAAGDGFMTIQVPPELPPGPHTVAVATGAMWSETAGPLHVEPADPARPVVYTIHPGQVAAGGRIYLVGGHMDRVTEASGGFQLVHTDERACALATVGLDSGLHTATISGPTGTEVFTVEVEDGPPVVPQLTSAEPQPAFRGAVLTLRGQDLHEVTAAVLGGVSQPIDFIDAEEVRVTIAPATPLGAEPCFVAGAAGSAQVLMVTVLDPLPVPEPEPEPEPDAGPALDVGADAAEGVADVSVEVPPDAGPGPPEDDFGGQRDDDGCRGGPEGVPLGAAFAVWVGLALWRRWGRATPA